MRDPGDEGSTAELRTDGVRVTRQRVAILQVLREASDHPGAEDILMRARAIDPTVSLATVYRTLSVLEKAGTVLRNDPIPHHLSDRLEADCVN